MRLPSRKRRASQGTGFFDDGLDVLVVVGETRWWWLWPWWMDKKEDERRSSLPPFLPYTTTLHAHERYHHNTKLTLPYTPTHNHS